MREASSGSRKRRSISFRRSRALKRNPSFRPVEERDLFVSIWLAYKAGAFPQIEPGLTKEDFATKAAETLVRWHDLFVLESSHRPVGLVMVGLSDHRMVPHVHWFPWARPRNKLEAALKFINVMRKRYGILIATDRESEPFFTHLVRYGVLRRIGTSRQWYSGKETPLFESVAPQNAGES